MTAITRNNYIKLRKCMLDTSNNYVNTSKLEKLKRQFEIEINSPRRLENIETLKELIEVLEKRACLSEDDITALTEIATTINNTHYLNELEKINNICRVPSAPVTLSPEPQLKNADSAIKNKIHNLLINELGRSWTDFARGLCMREGTLDEIKYTHRNDLQASIQEVLRYHSENAHPKEWEKMILDALSEARRNDLRKSVEYIYRKYYTYT